MTPEEERRWALVRASAHVTVARAALNDLVCDLAVADLPLDEARKAYGIAMELEIRVSEALQ